LFSTLVWWRGYSNLLGEGDMCLDVINNILTFSYTTPRTKRLY
jgi:hypothetical protein